MRTWVIKNGEKPAIMNLALLNISANVGKTTVAKYLLQPRLSSEYICMDGRQPMPDFTQLQAQALTHNNLLVDVASGHTLKFIEQMQLHDGSCEDYTAFIIPVCGNTKTAKETAYTLQKLFSLGIDPQRIRLVFNRSARVSPLLQQLEFEPIIQLANQLGIQVPNTVMLENAVYSKLDDYSLSIEQVLNEPLVRAEAEYIDFSPMQTLQKMQQLAVLAKANLDALFDDLCLTAPESLPISEASETMVAA